MFFFQPVQTGCCVGLASAPMSYSSVSSAVPFEYPPSNSRSNPPAQATHAWGAQCRKEPVAAVARPLSERCTQFRERILFLGPPICQEERKRESSGTDSQEDRENENETENHPNPEAQQNTVTSTLTMQEYFAQRMAQLKRAQVGNGSAASSPGVSSNAPSSPASTEDSTNTMERSQKKKKKRKEKNRDQAVEKLDDVALTSVTESVEEPRRSKKKQKKSKRDERGEDEESSAAAVMNDVTEEDAPIPEKRKKTSPEMYRDKHQVLENETIDREVSIKKKKKKKQKQKEQTE